MSTTPAPAPAPFPLNRVVAFLGPVIALAAGSAATWLGQNFPGLHLDATSTAAQIAAAIEFVVGAGITFALQHKWLDGWQKWETTLAPVVPAVAPVIVPAQGSGLGTGTVVVETPVDPVVEDMDEPGVETTADDPFAWR
jgi:hypothetical protein